MCLEVWTKVEGSLERLRMWGHKESERRAKGIRTIVLQTLTALTSFPLTPGLAREGVCAFGGRFPRTLFLDPRLL